MNEIKFNYRNRQGQPVKVSIPLDEIKNFEEDYKSKLSNKYNESLVLPTVEVVVSEDGSKILDVHLLAQGKLE